MQPNLASCLYSVFVLFLHSEIFRSWARFRGRKNVGFCAVLRNFSPSKSLNWASGLLNMMHLFCKASKSLVKRKNFISSPKVVPRKNSLPKKFCRKVGWWNKGPIETFFKLRNSENLTNWTLPNRFHRCLEGKLEFFYATNRHFSSMTIGMKMMSFVHFLKIILTLVFKRLLRVL